jgi:hypothetical protein
MLRLIIQASAVPLTIAALFACGEVFTAASAAISHHPSTADPAIYLSRDGPADEGFFLRSQDVWPLDAAAMISGAPRIQAASPDG